MPISKLMEGLPSRSMLSQDEFDKASEKLMVELPQWGTEANALEANVNLLEASTTLKAAAAAASALVAQTAAANSVAVADVVATSTDTRTLATGDVTFNAGINKGFKPNMPISVGYTANPGQRFIGYVNSYNPATGLLAMGVEAIRGGGTYSAWTITISGPYLAPFAAGGAAADYALASDRTLTAASARLQVFTPAIQGANVNLPDATMLVPGQAQFTLVNAPSPSSLNAVSSDLGIRDWAGVLKGFARPDSSVRASLVDALTAAGVWSFEGLSPVGVRTALRFTASTVIGGTAGTFVKAVPLDADRLLLLIYGVSLHAVIYNRPSGQFGSVVLLRASFATAGAYDNVVGLLIGTDKVLVTSVGEGATAMQAIVLTLPGIGISPGSPVPVTLGGACSRQLEPILVGTSYVFGYMVSTTSIRFRAFTVSGTVPTAAVAETTLATVAPPALLEIDATRYAVMTASATVLTITPYSVTATVSAVGTAATTNVSSSSSITVKPGLFTTYQRWIIGYLNSGARLALVAFSGASPAATIAGFRDAFTVLTAVTGLATIGYNATVATASTGTASGGEFGVEFFSFTDTGSDLQVNSSADNFRSTSAAATIAPLAVDLAGAGANNIYINWQVSTAKEMSVYACKEVASFGGFFFAAPYPSRKGLIPGALALPVPAIYPKLSLAAGTLTAPNSSRSVSLGDGSKPPLYCADGAIGHRALPTNLAIPGDTVNASQGFDTSSVWMAYSQGPSRFCDLLQVRLA